jgi:hypothetical protein
MGRDESIWYHVVWNTLSSWLPGDPRGFHNRDHRVHSSGDYKHPPPPGEHEGLLRYNESRAREKVILPYALRPRICEGICDAMARRSIACVALSVGCEHVHGLMALSSLYKEAQTLVGKLKNVASLAVRNELPGSIWSRGCNCKPVTSNEHWAATEDYILNKQEGGTFVWDPHHGGRFR